MEVSLNNIYYFIREGLWRHAINFCTDEYKRINDPAFIYWKAYCLYREGSPNDAINELTTIQNKRETMYAVVCSLIYYHQRCQIIDKEAVDDLKSVESEMRRTGGDKSYILLAYFHIFNDELRKARDYLEMANQSNPGCLSAKGWYEVASGTETSLKNALQIFENQLKDDLGGGSQNLDALMGRAKTSELQKKFSITIDTLNEIIVVFPKFIPAQIEKSKLLMIIGDWEPSIELTQKILSTEKNNIHSLKMLVFYLFSREGNLEEGLEKLQTLVNTIERVEPKNPELLYNISQLFSRVSGRNPQILAITYSMVEKARKMRPIEADYAIELAYHNLMMNNTQAAYQLYQEAASLDETKLEALTGMIHCRLLQGMIDDAEKQIEFVNEVQVSAGRTPEIAFLEGLLNARKPNQDRETKIANTIKCIDEALKLHIATSKGLSPGFDFYIRLNPEFLLNLAKEYLQYANLNLGKKVEIVPPFVTKGNKLLETITKQIPGLIPAYLLLAKGKLLSGDPQAAMKNIQKVIEMNSKNEEAFILHALISFQSGNMSTAYNSLDQAIANNFNIRENPLFMMVKGELELKNKDYVNALATLEAAFELPGVGKTVIGKKKAKNITQSLQILSFEERERCKIFVLLAKAYTENKKIAEAKNIMNEAIRTFSGTPEEGTVLMANAEISVANGDIQKALSILKAVDAKNQYYVEAKRLMAEIYLKNLLDRRHYARCYIDIVEANPSFENYKILGEAFLKIQEPEDAISAYEQALKMNPGDEEIIRQIGKSLVLTHNYENAMRYYEDALKTDPNRLDLRLELGKLCIMINRFDKAEDMLRIEIFGDEYNSPTSAALKRNVQGLMQIAKLNLKKFGRIEGKPINGVKDALQKALGMQSNLIERLKQEGSEVDSERKAMAEIYFELGKYFIKYEKNDKKSLEFYEASLKQDPENVKILMSLAELNSDLGLKPQAEIRCQQVLKLNSNNESAASLLSELYILKGESQKSIELFKKILQEKPGNFGILAKLIDVMRKSGSFDEIKPLLDKVQKKCPNPNDPGLCYCKGLYFKYARMAKEALSEFIKAKRSSQFCQDSIINMIDIYLNPDQELMYTNLQSDGGIKQVDVENLKAADNLVKELSTKYPGPKAQVQEAYVLIFSKNKIDKAIEKLNEVNSQRTDYIPGLYALCIAKSIAGKQAEAKNYLKVLAKSMYTYEYAEDLEKSWLLMADYLIYGENPSDAENILSLCIRFNQSCGKAEEYLGLIDEQRQNFKTAAEHYEKAWKLTLQKSPSIGYRLAYNYLKSKKYIECINICKDILQTFPDFQKIDKDILSKARAALRA